MWHANHKPPTHANSTAQVTGCSAGGYASLFWSLFMLHGAREHTRPLTVEQISDASAGIGTHINSFPTWNMILPDFLDIDFTQAEVCACVRLCAPVCVCVRAPVCVGV